MYYKKRNIAHPRERNCLLFFDIYKSLFIFFFYNDLNCDLFFTLFFHKYLFFSFTSYVYTGVSLNWVFLKGVEMCGFLH